MAEAKPPAGRWLVLIAAVLTFMLAFALAFAITSPSVPAFMREFGITDVEAALLMTVLSVAAAIMSIPAGILTDRWGPRRAALLSVMLMALGWIICAVAPNYTVILLGRAVIGLGGVTFSIVAPAAIVGWFPPRELGTAMGIWALGMPVGLAWEIPLTGYIIASYGWRTAYLVGLVFSLIALGFTALAIKPGPLLPPPKPEAGKPPVSMAEAFKSLEVWKFSVAVLLVIIPFQTIMAFYLWWLTVVGYDEVTAASVAGLIGLVGIFAAPFSGWLSDRLGGRRKLVFTISAILLGLVLFLIPSLTPGFLAIAITVLIGLFSFMIPPHMFSIPTVLVRPELAGTALGIVITFFYIAGIIGPPMVASIFASYGLSGAAMTIAICSILGGLVGFTTKTK